MKILYCDDSLIICIKPVGALSADEPGGMPALLRRELGEGETVLTVHRLDSVVAGVMVYARTKQAASELSRQMNDGSFHKEYLAVLEGYPTEAQAELRDLLLRDRTKRKTYVTKRQQRGAQEAVLRYRTCGKSGNLSLVRIELLTGRTHQIRAQFSSRQLPLYGDGKYGAARTGTGDGTKIALWSCQLSFLHPVTGEQLRFQAMPPEEMPWTCFPEYTAAYAGQDVAVEFQRSPRLSDCRYSDVCGGCAYQGMPYAKQLEKKQRLAAKWLRSFGSIAPIIGAESPTGYRNKTTAVFWPGNHGSVCSGMYGKRGHVPIRIERCPMDQAQATALIRTLRTLMEAHHILPFDEKNGTGWLRQIQIRCSSAAGEILLAMTAVSDEFKSEKEFLKDLLHAHPEITTTVLCVTPSSREAGSKADRVLYGTGYIHEKLCGASFRITARSAFPVNPGQTENVYRKALEFAALTGCERVLHVGCATGVLSIFSASCAGRVLAVEQNHHTAAEAAENVKLNAVQNIRIVAAEPGNYLDTLVRNHERFDRVFLTGQTGRGRVRNGSRQLLKSITALSPERIVCIYRDPEALAEELTCLADTGYQIEAIVPFDELPYTGYVTTVVLLSAAVSDTSDRLL